MGLQLKYRVEPKVDGLGEKWMDISHEGVKAGWVKVAMTWAFGTVHFGPNLTETMNSRS